MPQAASLFIRLEYGLAERLFHNRWLLPRSPRAQRLTMRLFKRCAEAGHPVALSVYGHILFHRSLSPQDKARGARYVIEAAHAGDLKAQYQVAQIYEHGSVQYPRREDYAVTWYARAAQAGHYLAAERLARAYCYGELGLAVDNEKSTFWQRQADAKQGIQSAPAA
ncbi:sel1 repeat family protein [Halomonas sp. ZH2S]|uniref:Sel1 repeat family protein n=1 Tax=Vreelandella zhuhanensis TaxID=2684210 RepID=A0A7X3KQL7_9GAMM|nr:SEL1-like repeat protein [Halomonas zhuhanensis]MWJ27436.1 sel1 repeat family protein [Halomonas zhuhanensis]